MPHRRVLYHNLYIMYDLCLVCQLTAEVTPSQLSLSNYLFFPLLFSILPCFSLTAFWKTPMSEPSRLLFFAFFRTPKHHAKRSALGFIAYLFSQAT